MASSYFQRLWPQREKPYEQLRAEVRLQMQMDKKKLLMEERQWLVQRLIQLAEEYVNFPRSYTDVSLENKELRRRVAGLTQLLVEFNEKPVIKSSVRKIDPAARFPLPRPVRRARFNNQNLIKPGWRPVHYKGF